MASWIIGVEASVGILSTLLYPTSIKGPEGVTQLLCERCCFSFENPAEFYSHPCYGYTSTSEMEVVQ